MSIALSVTAVLSGGATTAPILQMQNLRLREAELYLLNAMQQCMELGQKPGSLIPESQSSPPSSAFS